MDTMFGFNVLSIEGFSSFSWFMEVIFLLDRTFTQQQEMACRAFQRAHLRLQTAPLDEKRSAEHVVLMVVTNLWRVTALSRRVHHCGHCILITCSILLTVNRPNGKPKGAGRFEVPPKSRNGR